MGVSWPKPMYGFSPNFQDMLTQGGSRADYILGVSGNNCCHGNTLNIFGVLTLVGVPQPKPMHGFSPNFKDMLIETGSIAE